MKFSGEVNPNLLDAIDRCTDILVNVDFPSQKEKNGRTDVH